MRPASVGFQCPDCVKAGNAGLRTPKAAYGGTSHGGSLVTYGLIGLNLLMFVVTAGYRLSFSGGSYSELFLQLSLRPTTVFNGQHVIGTGDGVAEGAYYRLLTSTFLHFGVIHILLNMLCLYQLGPYLEGALGRVRYLAVYLLSGLGGAALSFAAGPANENAAGASGAVFGLFGAFYVLQRQRGLDASAIVSTIGLNLFFSFAVSGIDWRGHVGGLIAGGLVAAAIVHAPRERRALVQVGGSVGVALLIVVMVAVRAHELRNGAVFDVNGLVPALRAP
jgi:membrane associated rhomboid family serine protease